MCTTIIVGSKASSDGSFLVARSADSSSLKAQHFLIHPASTYPAGSLYRTQDYHGATDFTYPLPEHSLRYTTIPNWKTQLHGAAGYNEAGLGVTGTESIFARDDALAFDPYNKKDGITEDDIADVLLCRCRSAKEAVELLGSIVEKQGAGEGFGVAAVDEKEIWYFETGTGHQWMAQRMPEELCFASANQGRLKTYDPENPDILGSPTLIDFAREHGFYDPEKDGAFDFARAYTRDDDRDRIYNDPRVWSIYKSFNPSVELDPHQGRDYPLFLKADRRLGLDDVKAALRDHFAGTSHDPYAHQLNGAEPWRPVSVFRTYEAHVLQVRPWLPRPIGEIVHVAFGMADLSVFLPFYHGLSRVPVAFTLGTDKADRISAYWKFRKLQTLVMSDYDQYAPVVKTAFAKFEAELAVKRDSMESEYCKLLPVAPKAAQALLDEFNLRILIDALELADRLTDEIFTMRTHDVEMSIRFVNNKHLD